MDETGGRDGWKTEWRPLRALNSWERIQTPQVGVVGGTGAQHGWRASECACVRAGARQMLVCIEPLFSLCAPIDPMAERDR